MIASGTRIEPYEVLGSLGAGGMGEVYRATDTKLKRQVAIKILPPGRNAVRRAQDKGAAAILSAGLRGGNCDN